MGGWINYSLKITSGWVGLEGGNTSRRTCQEVREASMALAGLVMNVGGLALDIVDNHDSLSEAFQALRDRFERDGITERAIWRKKLHELHLPIGGDPLGIIQEMEKLVKKLRSLGAEPDEEE
ncbi:unnamed protein product [Choristocarpus tenellus]